MGWNLLPTGILTDVSSVVAGGILGCAFWGADCPSAGNRC